MRSEFFDCGLIEEVWNRAPWAAEIAITAEGYRAFESIEEYSRFIEAENPKPIRTFDGGVVYDLSPTSGELCAVAGPRNLDVSTIDLDNLPTGVRWITSDEWEDLQRPQMPFILVFRPHQSRAWAETFENALDLVEGWRSGDYDRNCGANFDLSEEESRPSFKNAIEDIGHDLHALTILETPLDVLKYLQATERQHNPAKHAVRQRAIELGWIASREQLVLTVEAAEVCCPEVVCDHALEVYEKYGDWMAVLSEAIKNNADCEKVL